MIVSNPNSRFMSKRNSTESVDVPHKTHEEQKFNTVNVNHKSEKSKASQLPPVNPA